MQTTDRKWIPVEECAEGNLYALLSRNLDLGVYRGLAVGGFVGIREKMGNRYLATEYHWDTDSRHGTAQPVTDLGPCPVSDLREFLGMQCSHGRKVRRETGPKWRRPSPYGGEILFTDFHADDGSKVEDLLEVRGVVMGGTEDEVRLIPNTPLFDWLDAVENLERGKGLDHGVGCHL